MKKILTVVFAMLLCLSLISCGNLKLSESDVTSALENCGGTLDMTTEGGSVSEFTYVVTKVNADDLTDKGYAREAMDATLSGNTSSMTYGQYQAAKAMLPIISILALLEGDSDDFDANAFINDVLSIICDGKTVTVKNWEVSSSLDTGSDKITITVKAK